MPENERPKFINFYVEDETRKGQPESAKQFAIALEACKPEDLLALIMRFAREVALLEREACARMVDEAPNGVLRSDTAMFIRVRPSLRIGFFEF